LALLSTIPAPWRFSRGDLLPSRLNRIAGRFVFAHRLKTGKSIMRYLGAISGSGVLKCDGQEIARASYDFEGFFRKPVGVTSSGEIRSSAGALKSVFGRSDVQLFTDDGRLLDLRFSEKTLPPASDVVHVDVTAGLPADPENWGR
jgi:hypothetical protein